MKRTVLSGAVALACFGMVTPSLASDVHDFLRKNAERMEERREARQDIAEKRRDLRSARTVRDRREAREELREEVREARREMREERREDRRELFEGRAAVRGAAPSDGSMRALVARYAAKHGVPRDLAHGVVMVESRYRANATGPGGYIGLMQIGYRTAKGMGYSGSRKALYNPQTNLEYGMRYLGEAYRQAGGDYCRTVSKYQGGHGVRGVTRAGAAYCGKVKKYMARRAPGEEVRVAQRGGDRS